MPTIPPNNSTGLYGIDGSSVAISNDVTVDNLAATGNITAGANIAAGNNVTVGGNLTVSGTIFGNITGNLVVPGANTEVLFNSDGNAGASSDFTFNDNTNVLDVNGNVQANYFIGDGSQLTNLPASSYGNANVVDLLDSFGSNVIVTTGNITGGYFIGNGSQLTGLPASYSDANVTTLLAAFGSNVINTTGNITGGTFIGSAAGLSAVPGANVTGTVANATFATSAASATTAGTVTTAAQPNITSVGTLTSLSVSGNIAGGNISTAGQVAALGNISGSYILGNGSQLTGLPEGYGNANVSAYLASGTNTANIVTTGNISGANISGTGLTISAPLQTSIGASGILTYGDMNAYLGNVTGANLFGTIRTASQPNITTVGTLGSLSVTGNVTAGGVKTDNYYYANGTPISFDGTYSDANVAAYLPTYTGNLGNVTDITMSGNLVVGENLTVNGNTIYTNITELNVQDPIISQGRGANNTPLTTNDGKDRGEQFWYYTSEEKSAFSGYDNSAGKMLLATDVSIANEIVTVNSLGNIVGGNIEATSVVTSGNVTASYVVGNGSLLSSITGANVVGTVASATQANTANTANAVSGANVSGQVANALVAGTVYTAAQPAITSVGTLTSLSVTGNTATGGINTDNYRYANGTPVSFAGTYGNANVNALLASWGSNVLSTTGNVTGGNLNATDNVVVGNIQLNGGNGRIYTNANIAVGSTIRLYGANGLIISNDLDVNNELSAGNITATGHISAGGTLGGYISGFELALGTGMATSGISGTIQTDGNVILTNQSKLKLGELGVNGSNVISIQAPASLTSNYTLTLPGDDGNSGQVLTTNGSGTLTWSSPANATLGGSMTANIDGGDTYSLTNIAVVDANTITAAGNITTTSGNLVGNVFAPTTAGAGGIYGRILTANQSNITSVGTLGSLSVTGNISGGNLNITTDVLIGNSLTVSNNDVTFGKELRVAGNIWANASGIQAQSLTLEGPNNFIQMEGTGNLIGINNINTNLLNVSGNAEVGGILTNNYYYANGVPVTFGGGSTYGDANVNTLLAAWGSNTLSTTGNVTAGNFIGNGSALTTLTGANVTGSVAQATVANTANAVAGANVTGTVANATFATSAATATSATTAGTVTTNAQPNITSVGTLSSLSVTGNIATGGILTDGYYYANGTPVSFGGGSYGDSNVNTLLASWGSNTLNTTGNVTVGNLNMTGQVFDASGVLQLNAVGNIVLAPTGSAQIFGATDIIGGKLTTGAVTYANVDGTTGQVLTTYGNGVTYFSTVSGGSGSPGGSDGQIQFNDGGAFGGNAAMTFDDATGNVTLGNIVVQLNQQMQTVSAFSGNSSVRNPGQITIGNGYDGNITNTTYLTLSSRGARALSYDKYVKVDNGQRNAQLAALSYVDLNGGNLANGSTRVIGVSSEVTVINGNTAGGAQSVRGTQTLINAGQSANTGNANISGCQVGYTFVSTFNGSSMGNVWMNMAETGGGGDLAPLNTYIGYGIVPRHTANVTTGNVFGVYLPGTTTTYGSGTSNGARQANRYYFLRCDDDVAQTKLGSLRLFHEYRYDNSSSSNTLTVNKNNGQVQYIDVTEDISTVTFSNFVVSASDSVNTDYQMDTVTLVFRQDSTGHTITMPTGTAYKYAGGGNTLATTANAVQMVSVSAIYNATTAATEYLITISPEFV